MNNISWLWFAVNLLGVIFEDVFDFCEDRHKISVVILFLSISFSNGRGLRLNSVLSYYMPCSINNCIVICGIAWSNVSNECKGGGGVLYYSNYSNLIAFS